MEYTRYCHWCGFKLITQKKKDLTEICPECKTANCMYIKENSKQYLKAKNRNYPEDYFDEHC